MPSRMETIDINLIRSAVLDAAKQLDPQLMAIRQHLHKHPELTRQEFETTAYLAGLCRELGEEPVFAAEKRGLWCDVGGKIDSDVKRTLVRGDIDALPIQTDLVTDYRSVHDGVMHACGHDVHATCVWGAMAILKKLVAAEVLDDSIAVRFCFQPAEEDSSGGPHMVAAGVTLDCEHAIALHTDPGRPAGTIGVRYGSFTASCDVFKARFFGKGGHGARPHLTDDALTAGINWIQAIYERVPRSTDARHPVVVNVGSLHSGNAPNVVPASAEMTGTLRSTTLNARDQAADIMQACGESVAKMYGCRYELNFGTANPPVVNDSRVSDAIAESGRLLLGEPSVEVMTLPSMGAEDFAFIAAELPGSMFRLGIASESNQLGHSGLHTSTFDIDPIALGVGASVLALAAIELSRPDLFAHHR